MAFKCAVVNERLSVSSEKDEEHLALQINDINQRIDKEKAKYNKLKQKVQLHLSLNTEDQVREQNVHVGASTRQTCPLLPAGCDV